MGKKREECIVELVSYVLKEENCQDINEFYCCNGKKIEKKVVRETATPRSLRYKKREKIIFPYDYKNGKLIRYSTQQFNTQFPGAVNYLNDFREESYLSCAVRNICGNNLSDDMKPLYELCEYYRLIRNTSVHDLCEVDSHEKEYRKLQKYNFKTEAKFSKLVAPNKYEEISFDDFVMFSRSCVELATYIFEKMAYDYTKIALDIPDKQISKWRKYSKNRQEKALCSYIKTLYKVDEEFIEQIPKLLNMIIDPIV